MTLPIMKFEHSQLNIYSCNVFDIKSDISDELVREFRTYINLYSMLLTEELEENSEYT